MITVREDMSAYTMSKPVKCLKCGYGKVFYVPISACVRKSKRGKPPPGHGDDSILLKCRKCGAELALTIE